MENDYNKPEMKTSVEWVQIKREGTFHGKENREEKERKQTKEYVIPKRS